MKTTTSTNLALVAYQAQPNRKHTNLALTYSTDTSQGNPCYYSDKLAGILGCRVISCRYPLGLNESLTTTPLSPLIIKRYRHAKMADATLEDSNGNAPDKEKDDDANLLTTVDRDKEGNPETSEAVIDLPDASDNPLSEEGLKDQEGLEDLDDMEPLTDEIFKDIEDMNGQEYQDDQDDMEPLTDEIANALEELENEAEAEDEEGDKIIVDPVRTYENADTMKNAIIRENRNKSGLRSIYR